MSWQMYAYWPDRKTKQGAMGEVVADLDLGRGGGELPELLGLGAFDEGASKVSKAKVEAAFRECCKKHIKGDDIVWELHFLATILINWKRSEKSIFFLME